MTRRTAFLAFSFVVVIGLLGLQSWDLARGRIEASAVRAIEARTGFVVKSLERAEIALLPLPRISLSRVAFAQHDGAVAGEALRVRVYPRLLPLLAGRLGFDRIDLVAPQLDIAVPAGSDGITDWLSPPLAELEKLRSQSRIVIRSGALFLRAAGQVQSIVRDLNLVLDERELDDPLSLSGSFTWRGVSSDVSLLWPAAGGGKAALSASSPLLKLRFEGTRAGPGEPVIDGALALSTPSLPQLLDWFGEKSRLSTALGGLTLNADLQLKPREASFNNAVASLDGDRLDGVMKLTEVDGRFALSGTLAGAGLDLGRLIGRLPLPAIDARDPGRLDLDGWTGRDIDLRVSVDAARLNGARLADAATYLLVKKGRFEAGLLRASAYGGTVKARFLAVGAPAGVDVKIQAGLDKVDFGKAAADVPQFARLTGTGGFQLALDGAGGTFDELLGGMTGRAGINLRQGEIGGVALADLVRRAERNPSQLLRDWHQGKTPFETLTANAGIANGLLVLTDAQMNGANYRLGLAGNASLRTRQLDMRASLASLSGSLRLPLVLKGPVDAPFFDVESEAFLSPTGSTGAIAAPTLIER
ncbi:AsmA family protein [Bosea minatitlanensis]|uniref:AsmA-like C-terminal region-containing protein n=1 Tax=Bosea minatitlanensis TaxID=128782 RepID=A0ABW0EZ23_9HYPH|nr:AsmA-like C-terminal region-containing protein [Bosea minatitlanensis]MCT4495464.1 AsmA family protein [Bosea minatitlanensis]